MTGNKSLLPAILFGVLLCTCLSYTGSVGVSFNNLRTEKSLKILNGVVEGVFKSDI